MQFKNEKINTNTKKRTSIQVNVDNNGTSSHYTENPLIKMLKDPRLSAKLPRTISMEVMLSNSPRQKSIKIENERKLMEAEKEKAKKQKKEEKKIKKEEKKIEKINSRRTSEIGRIENLIRENDKKLTKLVLSGLCIGNNNIKEILRLLDYKLITELDLSRNLIGPEATELLVNKLILCPHIIILNLSYNLVGDEGVRALVKLFPQLEELYLEYNGLNKEAFFGIYNGMTVGQRLKKLLLGLNFCEIDGVGQFSDLLNQDPGKIRKVYDARIHDKNEMITTLKEEDEAKKQTENINYNNEQIVKLLENRIVSLKAAIAKLIKFEGPVDSENSIFNEIFNKDKEKETSDNLRKLKILISSENLDKLIIARKNTVEPKEVENLEKAIEKAKLDLQVYNLPNMEFGISKEEFPQEKLVREEIQQCRLALEKRILKYVELLRINVIIVEVAVLEKNFKDIWRLSVNIFRFAFDYAQYNSLEGVQQPSPPPIPWLSEKAFKSEKEWEIYVSTLKEKNTGLFIYQETSNGSLLEAVAITTDLPIDKLRQEIINYLQVPENIIKLKSIKGEYRNINHVVKSLKEGGDGGDPVVITYILQEKFKIRVAILKKKDQGLFNIVAAKTGESPATLKAKVIGFLRDQEKMENLDLKVRRVYPNQLSKDIENNKNTLPDDTSLVYPPIGEEKVVVTINLEELIKTLESGGQLNENGADFVKMVLAKILLRPITINEYNEKPNSASQTPKINEELVNFESVESSLREGLKSIFIFCRNSNFPEQPKQFDGLVVKPEFNDWTVLNDFVNKIRTLRNETLASIRANLIESADLSFICSGFDIRKLISDYFKKNNSLKSLDLSNCNLTADDIELLVDFLKLKPAGFTLILNNNPIGDKGLKHLLKLIDRNWFLSFEAENCGIVHGINIIAYVLSKRRSDELKLQNLNLNYNPCKLDNDSKQFFEQFELKALDHDPKFAPFALIEVESSETPESLSQYLFQLNLKSDEIFDIQKTGSLAQGQSKAVLDENGLSQVTLSSQSSSSRSSQSSDGKSQSAPPYYAVQSASFWKPGEEGESLLSASMLQSDTASITSTGSNTQ